MSELNGEAESAAEEWENWANLVDQERVSRILREIFTGMLVAEGKCTESNSKNYINQLIREHEKNERK
jgi:polyhydroxyalkanoate synthesis regulator phasin